MTSIPHKNKSGNVEWRNIKGDFHRENGPAAVWSDGTKIWYINGQRHRENGPAFEGYNGARAWYLNDKRHRENGPAIEHGDGSVEYYLEDQKSPEVEKKVKENMARIQAQELFNELSQDDEISTKINTSSPKSSKKL